MSETPKTIEWPQWSEDWQKWQAIDANGKIWFYGSKPELGKHEWLRGQSALAQRVLIPKIDMAAVDWKTAIRKRYP